MVLVHRRNNLKVNIFLCSLCPIVNLLSLPKLKFIFIFIYFLYLFFFPDKFLPCCLLACYSNLWSTINDSCSYFFHLKPKDLLMSFQNVLRVETALISVSENGK